MNREEYIEILETENAELKYYNKELTNENNLLHLTNARILDLQQRIDKAIEYMCINYIYCLDDNGKRDFEDYDIQEIYKILKGE